MEHLEHIRANKGVIKKDNIGFFALRTDARLRELPVHIAQDVMHAVELMLYEAEQNCIRAVKQIEVFI